MNEAYKAALERELSFYEPGSPRAKAVEAELARLTGRKRKRKGSKTAEVAVDDTKTESRGD